MGSDLEQKIQELLAESQSIRAMREAEMAKLRTTLSEFKAIGKAPVIGIIEPIPGVQVLVTAARLSFREKQLFRLMIEGDSIKEIAAVLELAPATISQYLRTLYKKLGVHSRGELAARAREK